MAEQRFGVSTHLFHDQRLAREHVIEIARQGFSAIELFATRSHFDYHDDHAIEALADWLQESHVQLHSMHAPIFEIDEKGQRVGAFSTASGDESRRIAAVEAVRTALLVARRIPFRFLVLHLGVVSSDGSIDENRPDAARRSLEAIVEAASVSDVRVAVEVIPNQLSDSATLVQLIEDELEGMDIGICLDYGHAHLMGDLGDAIETLSGHLWTTHVHDNRGQRDEHLVPFAGTIDWDSAMMETQKIGYDDVLMFEVAGHGNPSDTLERSVKARERLRKTLITL
jgi:sugar phosphate isomerase/epimerase